MKRARLVALLVTLALCLPLRAQPLALNDAELGTVVGRDGISFDVANFSLSGNARFTYFTPGDTASTWIGNLALSRSDDPLRPLSDPYLLDIVPRPGLADFFALAFPANPDGAAKWQWAYDWGVNADGVDFQGGAWVFKDIVYYGGGLQITTPTNGGDGVAFGFALHQHIGDVLLRPRGRADTADAQSAAEQLHLRGVHISAAQVASDGTTTALEAPWQIAEVTNQPGIFNAITDASGTPRLHLGIGWPTTSAGAPWGSVSVDNLSFKSDITGNLDLGSSRIGAMQIQYLDILFRP